MCNVCLSNNNECLQQQQQQQQQLYLYPAAPYINLHDSKKLDKYIERVQARGRGEVAFGYFLGGYVPPGLQIGNPS